MSENPHSPSPSRFASRTGLASQRMAYTCIALVTLLLLGMDGWQSWTARSQALSAAQVATVNLARSLAQHAEDAFDEADTVLRDLTERVETDGLAPLSVERLRHLMRQRQSELEQLHGLFVYDKSGTWLASSNTVDPPHANNSDRDYFAYHRDNTDRGLHIGPVIRSRSTDQLIIPLSRRINDADGQFAGVALATLSVDYFNRFYSQFELDPQGVIALTLRNGTLLTRRPFSENVIGSSLARGDIFTHMLPFSSNGTLFSRAQVDGVERIYSYRAVSKYPLVVTNAQSKQAVLATWYANLIRSLVVVTVVLATMGLCARVLARQISHGDRVEAQLRNAHAALHKLAMQDSLTGLANRRQLDAALLDEIGRARRGGRPLGLIMLDIDHFKRFNDLYGQAAGDACIRTVGQAVLSCVGRAGDLVVRYGGEELLVVLPESDERGTRLVAEKILHTVRGLALHHAGNHNGIVTISAGIHVWAGSASEQLPNSLVQAAQQALAKAKSNGRNRLWPPERTAYIS